MSPPTITTRSVARFRCIAAACEDNCCHGWSVPVERLTYEVLKAKLGRSPGEREEFRAGVVRGRRPRTEANYAAMRPVGDDERCSFLDGGGLCSLQGRFGEEALPEICATYPRMTSRTDDRFEVFGYLSCPEMARLSLLAEDGLEVITIEGPPSRGDVQAVPARSATPYEKPLDAVRARVLDVLSLRDYPMSTRLFLLAYAGKKTAPFFHRGITTLDEATLDAELAALAAPATVAGWHEQLATMPVAGLANAQLVCDLLRSRLEMPSGNFRRLVVGALASHGPEGGVHVDSEGQIEMDLPVLWASYESRRARWRAQHGARIDLYFENFAKTYWQREWFTRSPDLMMHTLALLVRVAVVRFLLYSHPALPAVAGADRETQEAALDRAAVEAFYTFSRAVEHEGKFLAEIAATLVDLGERAFVRALNLALG